MFFIHTYYKVLWTVLLIIFSFLAVANEGTQLDNSPVLSIYQTIKIAQQNDPWIRGNLHQQQSLEFSSVAANTLPDPKVSFDLINLPTDGFNSSQEPITQFKVGVTQVFPRGQHLSLNSQKLKVESEAYPFQRQDREAKVAVTVGKLWLNLYKIQQSIALIQKHGAIFEQLIDITHARYTSALGATSQADIINAQIELTRLEERLSKLEQHKKHYEGALLQWLTTDLNGSNTAENNFFEEININNLILDDELPSLNVINTKTIYPTQNLDIAILSSYFIHHPAIIAIDKKIQATQLNIQLTKQKYKPEWQVGASYGHRRNDFSDSSRADLLSVGLTFDVPLFTHNKQDKQVLSAISHKESVKTEKHLLMREMLGMYSSTQGSLQRLHHLQVLYRNQLLPQVHDQAVSLLTSYTHDNGEFSEVVRSHLLLLNAELDQLTANVDEQKLYLTLNYLFVGSLLLNHQSRNVTHLNTYQLASSEVYDEK